MTTDDLFPSSEKGIVLALDVVTLEDLRALIELATDVPEVVGWKVGFTLALRFGLPKVVATITETSNLPIIYDHQKAGTDIPEMGAPFATLCRESGVQGVIFFPHAGPVTLENFVSSAFKNGLYPIVGLVMTHRAYLEREGGYIIDSAPMSICETAIELGVKGFVLPGTKTDIITQFASGPLATVEGASILMPGIGSQGGSVEEGLNAAFPHSRYAIIGSAIYNAPDPKSALEAFAVRVRS
jgi:orotidine-5'-phosphate decarboxylase